MKILIFSGVDGSYTKQVLDYFIGIKSEIMKDIVVIDIKPSNERREMVGSFGDLTYVYFEEDITPGSALNQVISGLELDDDIVVMDSKHVPLLEAIERLKTALDEISDSFAVGPVSNSFSGWRLTTFS